MQLIQNKKLLTLSSILTFLILLFGASFIKPIQKKSKELKTAILNPKYEISKIVISDKNKGQLILENNIDFWGAQIIFKSETFQNNLSLYFPCNNQTVNDFLLLSSKITDYNLIISMKSKKELSKLDSTYHKFGLDAENAISLTFYDVDNIPVSKLYFGYFNETMDQIFFRTEKNYSVYSMNTKIADYLNVSTKFWSDQNMIPKSLSKNLISNNVQNIFCNNKKTDISASEKICSLRYSEIKPSTDIKNDSILELKVIDDKTTEYNFSFYKSNSDDMDHYIYSLNINPSMLYSQKAKDFIKKLNCCYTISEWTFSSLTKSISLQ